MILDIIIIGVIIIAGIVGYKCGLASMLSRLGGWLASIVLAFILCTPLRMFLCENTHIDEKFYYRFSEKLGGDGSSMQNVPDLFKDQVTEAQSHFVNATATKLTEIVMAIFAFLIIVIVVKLIAFAFKHLFSKKHNDGFIGFTDGLVGLVMGLVIGVILVITLMAFAVPFAMSSSDAFAEYFQTASEGSLLSPFFYDYNLILAFISNFVI